MKTKIKRLISLQRLFALIVLGMLVALSMAHSLSAQTAFTQGYGADEPTQRGMIVQLTKEDAAKIEPVSTETMDRMHGVVTHPNDAPVTLSNEGEKVFVATSGHYAVLVSSQSGPVEAGDYITISAISGVGMKAGTKEPYVVGRALSGFDGSEGAVASATVKDSLGEDKKVSIGRVTADIDVSRNPHLVANEPDLPEFLQKATEAIAGKPVSPLRAYAGMLVFIISTIIAGILMYGGIRSAITSIGRNPLSKKSIIRGMAQVTLTGLIIFISGLIGVYLILKL